MLSDGFWRFNSLATNFACFGPTRLSGKIRFGHILSAIGMESAWQEGKQRLLSSFESCLGEFASRALSRYPAMPNNKKILIAADHSEATRRAVQYVSELVGGQSSHQVTLLRLELPPRMIERGGSEDAAIEAEVEARRDREYEQMEREKIDRSRDALRQMQSILTRAGIRVNSALVQFEEPLEKKNMAEKILETAANEGCGTVVVGRHSFSGWKSLFQSHLGEELVRAGERITIWVVE